MRKEEFFKLDGVKVEELVSAAHKKIKKSMFKISIWV